MSRFKEIERIERAIKDKNIQELDLALSYSNDRISIAKLKVHIKYWNEIKKRIENIIR